MYTSDEPITAPVNPATSLMSLRLMAIVVVTIKRHVTSFKWFFGSDMDELPKAEDAFFNPSLAPFEINGNPKIMLRPVASLPRFDRMSEAE